MSINFKNTETDYGLIGRALHWTSVALLVATIVIAGRLEDIADGSEKLDTLGLHSSIGLILLVLMLSRLYWRGVNLNPIKSYSIRNWQKLVATSLHRCIYLVLLAQCVIGIVVLFSRAEAIQLFGLIDTVPRLLGRDATQELATSLHAFVSILIYPLFVVHIVAAIYHQIFGVIED